MKLVVIDCCSLKWEYYNLTKVSELIQSIIEQSENIEVVANVVKKQVDDETLHNPAFDH